MVVKRNLPEPQYHNSRLYKRVHQLANSRRIALVTFFACLLLITACGGRRETGRVIGFYQPLRSGMVQSYVVVELDDGAEVSVWLPEDQDIWDTMHDGVGGIRIEIRQKGDSWIYVGIVPARKLEKGEISVALLPLTDWSPGKDQEALCIGFADEIIKRLSANDAIRIIDRESSFRFSRQDFEISDIGTQLNVSYVLEGTVRRSDDQVRITLQLIRVADDTRLWTDSFDIELQDLVSAQDNIASFIVDALTADVLRQYP